MHLRTTPYFNAREDCHLNLIEDKPLTRCMQDATSLDDGGAVLLQTLMPDYRRLCLDASPAKSLLEQIRIGMLNAIRNPELDALSRSRHIELCSKRPCRTST